MIRIKPPKFEKDKRKLCNCSDGKPRSNPWRSYHFANCPYLEAMNPHIIKVMEEEWLK